MKEIECKGQAIRNTHQVIQDLWGDAMGRQLLDGLEPEFGLAMRTGLVVSSGWYPIAWYRQLHEGLARLLPHELDLPARIGRATTERDLSGIYRFILKLTSPTLIARHFDKIVSSYLRGGELEVVVHNKTFSVEAQGWYGLTPAIWAECAAGGELIFERTGAKSVHSRVRETSPGCARLEFSWE